MPSQLILKLTFDQNYKCPSMCTQNSLGILTQNPLGLLTWNPGSSSQKVELSEDQPKAF